MPQVWILYLTMYFASEYNEQCLLDVESLLLCWKSTVTFGRLLDVTTSTPWQGPLWPSGQISVRTFLLSLHQHLHIRQQSTLDMNTKTWSMSYTILDLCEIFNAFSHSWNQLMLLSVSIEFIWSVSFNWLSIVAYYSYTYGIFLTPNFKTDNLGVHPSP